MSFERFLQLIREGEPATPGVTNRPHRRQAANIEYIWDVLQAAALGSTLYARRVTIDSTLQKGMPVYFNSVTQQFEKALAAFDSTPTNGLLLPSASSDVWGIVARKINSTLADILLAGYDDIDISAAVTGDVTAGLYYLSGQTEGMLLKSRQPNTVPVLRSDGNGKVFVMPQLNTFLDRHVHYKFPLVCRPAGDHTEPSFGDHHVITNADDEEPGWLPADDPSFDGNAPEGAIFGYNLNAHQSLKDAWPPLPLASASLVLQRPDDPALGGMVVPLGPTGACILDRFGIWWTRDCYGDVPWPTDYNSADPEEHEYVVSECPRFVEMELTLWFTKQEFATDVSVVRSLRSASDRLVVTCIDGTPASAGDLLITLNLDLVVNDDARGYLALKSFDQETATFERGPVVEGIYATGANITLSGDETSLVDPEDEAGPLMYHGKVHIEVNPATTRELDVQLIRLDSAEEEHYQDLMYLGLSDDQLQQYRARIDIPADLGLTDPQLKLRLRVLGRAAGALPQLEVTGRRVPRPDGVTPEALPLSAAEFAITIDTTATLANANEYVEFESEDFEVAAGDSVFFTVKRDATGAGDGYAAQVGILQQKGILTGTVPEDEEEEA
jgi:hypothetical protein